MTLEEALRPGVLVSRTEAERELQAHGCSLADYEEQTGDRGEAGMYETRRLLEWLGY